MKYSLMALAFAGACLLVTPSVAGEKKAVDPKDVPPGKALTDVEFLQLSATGGNKEIQLSKLAESHSSSDKVKAFAKHMIDDHKKLGDTLAKIGTELKVGVVAGLDSDTKDALGKLKNLKGEEFDSAYAKIMVEDHQKTVDMFKLHEKNAKSESLKKAITEALPTIQHHLDDAKKLTSK